MCSVVCYIDSTIGILNLDNKMKNRELKWRQTTAIVLEELELDGYWIIVDRKRLDGQPVARWRLFKDDDNGWISPHATPIAKGWNTSWEKAKREAVDAMNADKESYQTVKKEVY